MKKIFTLIAGLMTCAAAYALPVGNPAAPDLLKYGLWSCGGDCWGLKIGYRGDFVANRKMKFKNGPTVKDFSIATNAGVLTLNLWDRIDIYGYAGESAAEIHTDLTGAVVIDDEVFPTLFDLDAHTKEGFAWGAGIKAILWECDRTTVGLSADYGHFKSNFNRVTLGGGFVPDLTDGFFDVFDPSNTSLNYNEYQISLGVSHRICSLVPYLAIKYSSARTNLKNTDDITDPNGFTSSRLRSHKKWGFVVGTSLVDSERMSVTAEGRFGDERALSILADIRF